MEGERLRWDDESDPPAPPGILPTGGVHSMQGVPSDARNMGLDRNVPEGAWLAFAGALNASKTSHRVVAWIILIAIALSLLLTLHAEFF